MRKVELDQDDLEALIGWLSWGLDRYEDSRPLTGAALKNYSEGVALWNKLYEAHRPKKARR